MIERALLAALVAGALFVLANVAAHFNPLTQLADGLGAMSCADAGWGEEACHE